MKTTIVSRGLFTRRAFWDGGSDEKERARLRFEKQWPQVPYTNQDLPSMGDVRSGYWIQKNPIKVEGQDVFWETD